MIEKLTPEQEAKMPFYVKKWTEIGLSTEKTNEDAAREWCLKAYDAANEARPREVVFVDSPKAMNDKLLELKEAPLTDQRLSYGQHDANIFAFYDFFRTECGLTEETEKIIPLLELSKETMWHVFFDEMAIICRKAIRLEMLDNKLHCNGRAAIEWADGYGQFFLHGINVPEWVATKPIDQITKQDILSLENADHRRELVWRMTPARLAEVLDAKTIDVFKTTTKALSQDSTIDNLKYDDVELNYELLTATILDDEVKLLKMNNPSVDGMVHIEGVEKRCNTCQEALAYRNGLDTYIAPATLT